MNRALVVALVGIAVAAGLFYGRRTSDQSTPPPSPVVAAPIGATLLEGLGDYSFPVTSSHPDVQRWFDQGLMLTYGFNHDAAERTYLKATELDPECAMCWWGAALVLGPHVNAAMDPTNNEKAWSRLQRAVALAPKASAREQAFIHALEARCHFMGQPGGQAGLADATHTQEAYHTTVPCQQPLSQDRKFGLAPVKVRDFGCISPVHMGFALGRSGCVG